MPELVELHHEWAARGVRVEGVSIDLADRGQVDTPEKLGVFVEHHGFALPVVAFRGDWNALSEHLKLPGGPPSTLLLGPDGVELGRIEGSADRAQFEALIRKALAR